MKYSHLLSIAQTIVSNIAANPPVKFSNLVGCINKELDLLNVAFDERRYVCAMIAQEARSRALGLAPPASKLLKKIAAYAYDAHDDWAEAGFLRYERERVATRNEIEYRRERENMLKDYLEAGLTLVGAMKDVVRVEVNVAPATINAPISAQIVVPAESVKRRVEAKPASELPAKPANDAEAPAPAPSPAS